MDILEKCNLCNRNCLVNRYKEVGYCRQTDKIRIAKSAITYFEEPCISNKLGSGTIFFSGCNMGCIFCQNMKISKDNFGISITYQQLAKIMLKLQKEGALNINLVTPTPHVIGIKKAIILAKKKGLNIPIIYNTGTFENINTIKLLDGLIDVYLPDLKYFNDTLAIKYSNVKNYFKVATKVIREMYNQVGKVEFDKDGNIKKGVIVRHLMLPTHYIDSCFILKYLYDTYHDDIYISIMNQYTIIKPLQYPELNKKVKKYDYDKLIMYAINLGIKNAYTQLNNTSSKDFIPDFDLEGI